MATLDLQEQAQVDALKAWWRANGKFVILGIVLALAVVAGMQYWKAHKADQMSAAATLFEKLSTQAASGDINGAGATATMLINEYGASAYAPRAAMLAAQADIQMGDPARAKSRLQWAINNATDDSLKSLARLNLAALLLDTQDYAGAMAQLNAEHPASFNNLFSDLRGDVLSAQGKTEEARAAYQQAYDQMEQGVPYRNLIQMKLDMIGVAK
ncbi:MAG: tetratricopeptide repeat protein [Gallionellaceae bacterium]|jgi:predicted negative regulator of RcsB-dependent stress response|nr:tetratricopeptide repeat protein [Gallionellaceae bacterium]